MENQKINKPRGGRILVDQKKCQGCLTCMLACSLVHDGRENLSAARIQIIQSSFGTYPDDIKIRCTDSCDLCAEAPFWSEPGGAGGKQACVEACPLGAARFDAGDFESAEADAPEINFRGSGWKKIGYPVD